MLNYREGAAGMDMLARQEVAQGAFDLVAAQWPESELKRVRVALDVWSGKAKPAAHAHQKAAGCFIPDLKDEPWLLPTRLAFSSLLSENYAAIREEARQILDGHIVAPPYGLADDAPADALPKSGNPAGWNEWRLYRSGHFCEERCKFFPTTTSTIKKILNHTPFMMNAVFLIMEPGEFLPTHYDPNNIFVNIWLPLEAPEGCYLTVAGITSHPVPGELLVFNHSYLHSAGNKGTTKRIVLSLSVLHPDLSIVEQEVIKILAEGGALGKSVPA